MSRPWMPFYTADYRADTAHLGALEHGIYLLLIMHYWQTGSLPDDDAQLARIASATPTEWRRCKPVVEKLLCAGLEARAHRTGAGQGESISSKRRGAAEQMHRQRAAQAGANHDANHPANGDANAVQKHTQPQPPSRHQNRELTL